MEIFQLSIYPMYLSNFFPVTNLVLKLSYLFQNKPKKKMLISTASHLHIYELNNNHLCTKNFILTLYTFMAVEYFYYIQRKKIIIQ